MEEKNIEDEAVDYKEIDFLIEPEEDQILFSLDDNNYVVNIKRCSDWYF